MGFAVRCLVRRIAIETVGGYEDSFPGMYEDQVFHAKLCLNFPVFVSSECWYFYRQHNGLVRPKLMHHRNTIMSAKLS